MICQFRKLLFIAPLLIGLLFACNQRIQPSGNAKVGQKPNIIFVFVDDMGYGDLPLYGNKQVTTPNIDKLAAEGTRFTQFYVNSPICSPSRTAVLTGQYPLRWNITSFLADSAMNIRRGMAQYLDPKAPSIGRIFKQNGYYTAHIGKWHLGGQRNVHGAPLITDFGFNSSLTSFEGLGERHGWLFETHNWKGDHHYPLSVQQAKLGHGPFTWIKRHEETQIYVNRVLDEIKIAQNNNQPFYINLWTSDVHLPVEAPPALRGDGSVEAQYQGVIKELDNQLGRLFDYIRKDLKLRDNTVIVLSSDNGPAKGIGSSGGLRGRKGQLYEGGIREPFIIWAPGKINPAMVGKVNNNAVLAGMDLPPSLLAIAGVKVPETIKFDGLNRKEVLLGNSTAKREQPVMWVRPPGAKATNEPNDLAIRAGQWKLLTDINGKKAELYNIDTNPKETNNLAEQNPELTAQLKSQVLGWFHGIRANTPDSVKPWQ